MGLNSFTVLCPYLFTRYNVSQLEEWLRSRGLQAGGAVATLEPLIQAAQLLQVSKKSEADGQALVRTCTALSGQQVGLLCNIIEFQLFLFRKKKTKLHLLSQTFVADREDSGTLHA